MRALAESFAQLVTSRSRRQLYRMRMVYSLGMDKTMPLVEARDALGQRVDAAHYADEATVITKNGNPRAVLISFETYQLLRGAAGADLGQTSDGARWTPVDTAVPETRPDQQ